MYVYVLIYDGQVSTEGYNDLDKAINKLEEQGYEKEFGLYFVDNEKHIAAIKELKIV